MIVPTPEEEELIAHVRNLRGLRIARRRYDKRRPMSNAEVDQWVMSKRSVGEQIMATNNAVQECLVQLTDPRMADR